MKLFGMNIGSSNDKKDGDSKKSNSSIKKSLSKYGNTISKHQSFIILIAIVATLAITSLQMIRFSNPSVDEARAQENLSKLKKIKIDDNVVEQIKSLQDSNATAEPNVDEGRTNPFTE